MLSFSQAFSRPYMANMQSTQRNGDAEGMTHAALTKSVTTHGDGGEHGEHGENRDDGDPTDDHLPPVQPATISGTPSGDAETTRAPPCHALFLARPGHRKNAPHNLGIRCRSNAQTPHRADANRGRPHPGGCTVYRRELHGRRN